MSVPQPIALRNSILRLSGADVAVGVEVADVDQRRIVDPLFVAGDLEHHPT
jgi:hypothetical protein